MYMHLVIICVFFLDVEELFYVLPEEIASCSDNLVIMKEMLTTAEKLVPQLDRNPQVAN